MNKRSLNILFKILSIVNVIIALLIVIEAINFNFIWISIILSLLISGSEIIKNKQH